MRLAKPFLFLKRRDAQPYARGDRLQAALAGFPSLLAPGGPSAKTLDLASRFCPQRQR